jgi:Sel1 repeat
VDARNSVRPFRETWHGLRRRLAVTALAAPLVFFSLCQCLFSQSNEAAEVQGSNVGRAMLKNSERSDPSQAGIGGESYKEAVRLYQEGRYVEAANAHQLACDRFDARACTDLGVMYRRGQGVKKDFPRAAEFSLRGCDGGNALGCTNLGLMYWNNVLPKNDKRAVELFGRGCDGGDKNGCRALAFMYENGQGVPKDPGRAAILSQRAGGQTREHRIPFQLQDGLILIETKINDEFVKLIVDTGSSTTALALRFLPPKRPVNLPIQTIDLVHGNMQVYAVRFVWSLDGQSKQVSAIAGEFKFPHGTDGIFGADILKTFQSARFDFQNSVLILEDQ